MKPSLKAITFLLASVAVVACQANPLSNALRDDAWGTVEIKRGETIRIAIVSARSEDLFEIGIDQLRGAELAVAERERVGGFPIELVSYDSRCSIETSRVTAQAIVDNGEIVGVIGHTCSESCLAAAPIYADAGYSMISPSCSDPVLVDSVTHRHSFTRVAGDDLEFAITAAEFVYQELAARRAAVVTDTSSQAQFMAEQFEAEFARLGGQTAVGYTFEKGGGNFTQFFRDVEAEQVDIVFAPAFPGDAVQLILQRNGAGLDRIPILGGQYLWQKSFLEQSSYAAANLYAVGPISYGIELDLITDAYMRRYDESPNSYAFVYAYDAMNILLDAIERASGLSRSGSLVIGRQALNQAMHRTTMLSGASGEITCTEWGDCGGGRVGIGYAQGSEWELVYIP